MPKNTSEQLYTTKAPINNLRLPIRVIIQPENGREHIKPTGKANNTAPRAASLRFRFCCIVAIRDAQLAKQSPAIKNMIPTAIRSVVRGKIYGGSFSASKISKKILVYL